MCKEHYIYIPYIKDVLFRNVKGRLGLNVDLDDKTLNAISHAAVFEALKVLESYGVFIEDTSFLG